MSHGGSELGDFLRTRRARVDVARVGLPPTARRRVPGLRREEVAALAGLNADYYARLEQGRQVRASNEVPEALARVFDLDAAERSYLRQLSSPRSPAASGGACGISPAVRGLLDELGAVPSILIGPHTEVLAANRIARLVFADFHAMPARERNVVRWLLFDQDARALHDDWPGIIEEMIGMLRLQLGRHPADPRSRRMVAELSAESPLFCRVWTDHRVEATARSTKRLFHPTAGELNFHVGQLAVMGGGGQHLFTFVPRAGTGTAEAIAALNAGLHDTREV
ncbi:helix-turn-helix transcriptional regulator [Kutzneria sp. 744]|uniref:helix-turn-helix transcriptional regulator n=1 Tax=Kutzneria sp. (strain 744) TaxID=345341 RepID=UPI0004B148ED|nr:helix-turn-helix transcriptional regulator [Kutzneria sp. 744]